MSRNLLAALVSGALALPMAAQVQADEAEVQPHSHAATYEHDHEMDDGSMSPLHAHQHDAHPHAELHEHSFTLYGSVRSGIIVKDDGDSDAMWDLGSVDGGDLGNSGDRLWSRIGVRASHELDNGMMAGLHIEKRLDSFRTRHQNVWLGGDMGRITLGQQGSPYHSAVGWDGANFTGGNFAMAPGTSRLSGVSFESDLGGPFNFKAMVVDDNSHMTPAGIVHNPDEAKAADVGRRHIDGEDPTGYGEGVDGFEISGSLAAGGMNINVGYADNDMASFMGATVGGSFGGVGWEVGFETMNPDMSGSEDTNLAGLFVDYSIGSGAVYFYYEGLSGGGDGKAWVAGYSHGLGSGVSVIGEHRDVSDRTGKNAKENGTTSILAVVVGF